MCVKKICPLLFICIAGIQPASLKAQQYRYELGFNLGAYVYQGDLSPGRLGSLKTLKPGMGIHFAKPIHNLFIARALFNYASLKGDEALYRQPEYRQRRAFAFATKLKELGVHLQYFPLGNAQQMPRIEPYAFAGISTGFINTQKNASRFDTAYFGEVRSAEILTALAQDNLQKNKRILLNIPVGVGLRYHINEKWVVSTETNFRLGGSDYLDGFSQAVNPQLKDHFYSQQIALAYKVGSRGSSAKLGCPVVN